MAGAQAPAQTPPLSDSERIAQLEGRLDRVEDALVSVMRHPGLFSMGWQRMEERLAAPLEAVEAAVRGRRAAEEA